MAEAKKNTLGDGKWEQGDFLDALKYLGGNILGGGARAIEGVTDAIGGTFNQIIGNQERAKGIYQDSWSQRYAQGLIGDVQTQGRFWDIAGQVSQGIGEMAPRFLISIGLAALTGGGSLAVQATSLGLLGTQSYGNAVAEGVQTTGELGGKEMLYGLGSAGIELLTEKMFGAANGVTSGWLDDMTKKLVKNGVVRQMIGEGFEEVVSTLAEPYLKRATIDKNASNANLTEVLDSFLVGALVSGVYGGADIAIKSAQNTSAGKKILANGNEEAVLKRGDKLGSATAKKVMSSVDYKNSGKITAHQIGKVAMESYQIALDNSINHISEEFGVTKQEAEKRFVQELKSELVFSESGGWAFVQDKNDTTGINAINQAVMDKKVTVSQVDYINRLLKNKSVKYIYDENLAQKIEGVTINGENVVINLASDKILTKIGTHENVHTLDADTKKKLSEITKRALETETDERKGYYKGVYDRALKTYEGRENAAELADEEVVARMMEELTPDSKAMRSLIKEIENNYTLGERFIKMLKNFRKHTDAMTKKERGYLEELYSVVVDAAQKSKNAIDSQKDVSYNMSEVEKNGQDNEDTNRKISQGNRNGSNQTGRNKGNRGRGELHGQGIGEQYQERGIGKNRSVGLDVLASTYKSKNINPYIMKSSNAGDFFNAIGKMQKNHTYAPFVIQHSIEDYSQMKLFTTENGEAGIAVEKDGNIVSAFSGKATPGALTTLLPIAIQNEGNKLDCYDGFLSVQYERYGFIPVARVEFNEQFVDMDAWSKMLERAEAEGNPLNPRPDIIFWYHNGDSATDVILKYKTYEANFDNLKYFSKSEYGDEAYDAAQKYRDEQQAEYLKGKTQFSETEISKDSEGNSLTAKQQEYISKYEEKNGKDIRTPRIGDIYDQNGKEIGLRQQAERRIKIKEWYNKRFGIIQNKVVTGKSGKEHNLGKWYDSVLTFNAFAEANMYEEVFKGEGGSYFANAVRDKNGKLITLYHGTTKPDITVFKTASPNEVGTHFGNYEAATAFAYSQYALNKTQGKGGTIYEVNLNITSPFESRDIYNNYDNLYYAIKKSIEANERIFEANELFKYWWAAIDEYKTGKDYFGKDTYAKIKENEAIKIGRALGDSETTIKAYEEANLASKYQRSVSTEFGINYLLSQGFDGYYYTNEVEGRGSRAFVALLPNQIKLTTNKNPTESSDIRFSTTDNFDNFDDVAKLDKIIDKEADTRAKIEVRTVDNLNALKDYSKHGLKGAEHLTNKEWQATAKLFGNIRKYNRSTKQYEISNIAVRRAAAYALEQCESLNLDEVYWKSLLENLAVLQGIGNDVLTKEELNILQNATASLLHLYRHYDYEFYKGVKTEIKTISDTAIGEQGESNGTARQVGGTRKVIEFTAKHAGDARSNFRLISGYNEDSVIMTLFNELTDGETVAATVTENLLQDVQEFLNQNKKYRKRIEKDKITLIVRERGSTTKKEISLTVDEAMQLVLTAKRAQAQPHLFEGGFRHYDRNKSSSIFIPTQEDIDNLDKQLTPEDHKFMEIAHKMFNEKAQAYKAEADMKYTGSVDIEEDGNYIPIRSDKMQIAQSFKDRRTYMQDFHSVRPSFTKKTVEGANNPLALNGLSEVIMHHAKQMGVYVGLYPAVSSFERIYNKTLGNGENKTSLKAEIHKEFGYFDAYVTKLMNDVQGNTKKGNALLNWVRKSYTLFQLGVNIKVIASQFASYPMAAVYVRPWNLMRGLTKKIDKEIIYKHSDYLRLRAGDQTIIKAESGLDNFQKAGEFFMRPIQTMDNFTAGQIFAACCYESADQYGSELWSDENYKQAAKLVEKVMRETQANYYQTERTGMMRSESDIMRAFNMFMSDASKQLSRLLDAIGRLMFTKKSGKDIKGARAQLARTMSTIATSAMIYSLIGTAVYYAIGKEDDDKTFLEQMFARFKDTLIGMFPFMRDAYGYFNNNYEINSFAADTLNSTLSAIKSGSKMVDNLVNGEPMTTQEIMKPLREIIYAGGQLTGIPTRNINSQFTSIMKKWVPEIGYPYDALFKTSYKNELQKAAEKGDERKVNAIMKVIMGERDYPADDEEVKSALLEKYLNGQNVLPKSFDGEITYGETTYELRGEDYTRFNQTYGKAADAYARMSKKVQFRNMSADDKVTAIKKLYDIYYYKAVGDYLGTTYEQKTINIYNEFVGAETLALFTTKIAGISGTNKKNIIRAIATQLASTPIEREILMLYAGYSTQMPFALKARINKSKLSAEEKKKLINRI